MPYIKQRERDLIDPSIFQPNSAGELNYIISQFVKAMLGDNPKYADFNAAIGALECAKLEIYRRLVAPYEDTKIIENGDVF